MHYQLHYSRMEQAFSADSEEDVFRWLTDDSMNDNDRNQRIIFYQESTQ